MDSLAVSKMLSSLIILGSLTVKLPLIYSCWSMGSTKGLSPTSLYSEVIAISLGIVYNTLQGFPLSTWGELLSVNVQNFIVVLLLWKFEKVPISEWSGLLTFYIAGMYMAVFQMPEEFLYVLPLSSMFIGWSGLLPQIYANLKNKSTGPLSIITQTMNVAGGAARIFTTLQEVDDPFSLFACCFGTFLQTVVFTQIIMYRGNSPEGSISTEEEQEDIKAEPPNAKERTGMPEELKPEVDAMFDKFFSLVNKTKEEEAGQWKQIVLRSDLSVEGHVDNPFCFRIKKIIHNTPAATIDMLLNFDRRHEWDTELDEMHVLEDYGATQKIYSSAKTVWPIAARDFVVLSSSKRMGDSYVNVFKSIEHPSCPEGYKPGFVRADARIMGNLLKPIPEGFKGFDGSLKDEGPTSNKCIMVNIGDFDPKGNLPQFAVSFFLTKEMPALTESIDEAVKGDPPLDVWNPPTPVKTADLGPKPQAKEVKPVQVQLDELTDKVDRLERVCYFSITAGFLYLMLKK